MIWKQVLKAPVLLVINEILPKTIFLVIALILAKYLGTT